jgi:hypothetical protein
MTSYSITELTDALVDSAATPDEKATLHRQVRNFYRRGMLPAVGVRDERGTAEFGIETLYRVRVLSALTSTGFDADSDVFRASLMAMTATPIAPTWAPSQQLPGAYRSRGGLRDAISGICNFDEHWRLSFSQQTPYLHGYKSAAAAFHLENDPYTASSFLEGLAYKTTFTGFIDLNVVFSDLPAIDFENV